MPPFFSPRKPKAPSRIDTEQRATNSHYYTVFKVVLKVTVITLVICIAFLPTVALRNKHGHHSDEVLVKNLEHPAKFDVSTELERQVTHVPLRLVKSAKLLVQQLRIRDSTLGKSTDVSTSEQVERFEDVTDATTDGIQYGDYTLGGSRHQTKSEIERLQHCSLEIKSKNRGKFIRQFPLPIREDDRVISMRCSWQERRKQGGRCVSHEWQPTSRSLIVDGDAALSSVHRLMPTFTHTPGVISTCSYNSEVKNEEKCPKELVNGLKPAENKPISILVRPPPVVPNTKQQSREAVIDEETSVNYRPYKADWCRHGWVRTTDGWCIYRGSFEHQTIRPEIFNNPPASKRSVSSEEQRREAIINEPTKLEPRPFQAASCPEFWVHTNDGWCYYRGSSNKPLGFWGPDTKKSLSSEQKRRDGGISNEAKETNTVQDDSFHWIIDDDGICIPESTIWADHDDPGFYSGIHSPFDTGLHTVESIESDIEEDCMGAIFPAPSCPSPWMYDDGWCTWLGDGIDDFDWKRSFLEPVGLNFQRRDKVEGQKTQVPSSLTSNGLLSTIEPKLSVATSSSKHPATTTTTHTSSSNSISTAISPTTTLPSSTVGKCDPPCIRTMDGRCFFDPNYERKHPQDPLSRPRKTIRQRRGGSISEERDVAPSWRADSCEPPWVRTDDGWCIYRPDYKQGTNASLSNNTEQSSTTNQSNKTPQPSATEQPDVTNQSTATAQPTPTETVTRIRHCISDLRGNLQCFEKSSEPWPKTTPVSSARHRRGLWPADWVPQTPSDCDRFLGNTFKHYQCLQSVKHKNVGLKLIMAFLLLAGFGSLVFLIVTCVNRAARPKAQPFRQMSGIVDANGMTQHSTPLCNTYPWNNKRDTNAMDGDRWARGPPAYDPLRQLSPEHSGSLVACTRENNCASGSSDSNQSWVRKLCNKCFKRTNSSVSDKEAQAGSVGNGLRKNNHRIDTLRLPSAKLATVRRASGLPSDENGDVFVGGSTETVVIGSVGKGSGSAVGMRGSDSGSAGVSGDADVDVASVAAGGLMKLGNLSGDTLVEPEPAMLECRNGKDGKDVGIGVA
ncbi:putative zn 2cys6 cluster transcripitional activator protein [Botrytis fragariae]|uniref:Putative zn 2cys6 cluster transcripitional activator protein n=1 Tax=Botrytis fragariae TaxID=1964551 RepID=A0A8H6AM97_9HELO|nr:putative zn 2cys6 cluster transcripitional activator protein [Botrytis fragariae]KAF5870176.1 putative zn 2cys6 cluster transcripitional activator protein [Botrytis fragariae]